MTAFFAAITSIASTFKVLDRWLKLFVFWYLANKYGDIKEDEAKALVKLLDEKDQRAVERFMGYSNAGKPSGIPGTDIVDTGPVLPNH